MSSVARRVGRIGGCTHPGRTGRSSSRSRAARWPRAASTCPARPRAGARRRVRARHRRRPRGRDAGCPCARRHLGCRGGRAGCSPPVTRSSPTPARGSTPRSPPGSAAARDGRGEPGRRRARRPPGPARRGGARGRWRRRASTRHPCSPTPTTAAPRCSPCRPRAPARCARPSGPAARPRTSGSATCGSSSTCRACGSTSTTPPRWPPRCASGSARTAARPSRTLAFRACRPPSTASSPTGRARPCSTTASRWSCRAGAAVASGLRHLRVGQRVSVELDEAGRGDPGVGRRDRPRRGHPLTPRGSG